MIKKLGTDVSAQFAAFTGLTVSHTLVAGPNRLVVVGVVVENTDTVDVASVSYGGQAMTKAVDAVTGTSGARDMMDIWYLLEDDMPADGANNVAVSLSGASNNPGVIVIASSYESVAQEAPESTGSKTETSPADATIECDAVPTRNSWVISFPVCGQPGIWSNGQGQVTVFDSNMTTGTGLTTCLAELRDNVGTGTQSLSSTFTPDSSPQNRLGRVSASFRAYVPAVTARASKTAVIKAYTPIGEFVSTLRSPSAIAFNKVLDGGLGELNIEVEGKYDNDDPSLQLGNEIRVFVSETDATEILVYSGYVSDVTRKLGEKEGITVSCLGWQTLLSLDIFKELANPTNLTFTKTATLVGAIVYEVYQMWTGAGGDHIRAVRGSTVDHTAGPTVTYKFENRTYREALDDMVQLATGGEHWYVDAHGLLWWKKPATTPDHTLVFGRHFTELQTVTSLSKVRNQLYLWNGVTSLKRYRDVPSINKYNQRRAVMLKENGATAISTAMDQLAARFLADAAKPPITMTLRVFGTGSLPVKDGVEIGYDIESIEPGDVIRLTNVNQMGADWLRDLMVVTQVDYRFDHAVLTLDVVPSGLDRFQRHAQRELDKITGIGAPTAYTT